LGVRHLSGTSTSTNGLVVIEDKALVMPLQAGAGHAFVVLAPQKSRLQQRGKAPFSACGGMNA